MGKDHRLSLRQWAVGQQIGMMMIAQPVVAVSMAMPNFICPGPTNIQALLLEPHALLTPIFLNPSPVLFLLLFLSLYFFFFLLFFFFFSIIDPVSHNTVLISCPCCYRLCFSTAVSRLNLLFRDWGLPVTDSTLNMSPSILLYC